MIFVVALLCAAAGTASSAQHEDLYPDIRPIIREAETASSNIRSFDDRSSPAGWAGHLYARAGYLGDAERAFSRAAAISPFPLLKAYVLYGDLTAADKMLGCIEDSEQKGWAELIAADVLWRMGQSSMAEEYVERARKTALRVTDQARRTSLLQSTKQDSQYMSGPAPISLSPVPTPPLKEASLHSPFPQFPITPEGLGDKTLKQNERQTESNRVLMEDLYTRLIAGDRDGLQQIGQTAGTPFQKALAIASIEHLWIQGHQPDRAEQVAATIPETDDECILAKAEALSSAASAWLRAGDADRGNRVFTVAAKLARSAHGLPTGQVRVLASISEEQAAGGLAATSQETLKIAEQLASQLPLPPPIVPGRKGAFRISHYRPDAYREIFSVALHAHDLATARRVAELWKMTGKNSNDQIIRAWVLAGDVNEAVAFARAIQSTPERAKMELVIAQQMLDQSGAPNI